MGEFCCFVNAVSTPNLKGSSHSVFLAHLKASAATLSSIQIANALSNLFPSKLSIVFLAQKPFYSQPNYSSWWLGIILCLFLRNHSTVSLTIPLGGQVFFGAYFEQYRVPKCDVIILYLFHSNLIMRQKQLL